MPQEGTQKSPAYCHTAHSDRAFVIILFSFIIPSPHQRALNRAADIIAAVHYLNVMGNCDTLCPPAILFFIFFLHPLLLIIPKSFIRRYFSYI